jgi:hypothetical protein
LTAIVASLFIQVDTLDDGLADVNGGLEVKDVAAFG